MKVEEQSCQKHQTPPLAGFFVPTDQTLTRTVGETSQLASGGKVRLGQRLTCRPLDAIGVDLNCQKEEEGAGVHGAALLVHLNRAAPSIALR